VPGHLHLAITVATMVMALRKASPVEVAAQVEMLVLMEVVVQEALVVMGEVNPQDITSLRITGTARILSPHIRNIRTMTLYPKIQNEVLIKRNRSNSKIRNLTRRKRVKAKVEGVRPLPTASRQSLKRMSMRKKKVGSFLK